MSFLFCQRIKTLTSPTTENESYAVVFTFFHNVSILLHFLEICAPDCFLWLEKVTAFIPIFNELESLVGVIKQVTVARENMYSLSEESLLDETLIQSWKTKQNKN